MKAIVLKARQIEKEIQAKAGVVVIQDANRGLYWEQAYFTLATQGDTSPTPRPDTSTESVARPCRSKTGSIIDLTALSEDDTPLTQNITTKAEVVVKQEPADDAGAMKVTGKGKEVRRDGDSKTNLTIATKLRPRGDGNAVAKTTKAETILANIADGLSPAAQEKREISRANLLRESINQDRRDRVIDERVQELKVEIQTLKKEINELRTENARCRDRAVRAITTLDILRGNSNMLATVHQPSATYMPATPTFANSSPYSDPYPYSIPLVETHTPEPEGVAGPGPQTMYHRQQQAENSNLMDVEDE